MERVTCAQVSLRRPEQQEQNLQPQHLQQLPGQLMEQPGVQPLRQLPQSELRGRRLLSDLQIQAEDTCVDVHDHA